MFAKEGANVAVAYLNEYRDAKETKRLVEEQGRECILLAGDVGNESFGKKAVEKTVLQALSLKERRKLDLVILWNLDIGAWCFSVRAMQRSDGRAPDQLRPVKFELGIAPHATGSVLISMGNTRVLCGAMIEETVPRWMKEQQVSGGWLTAEYSMLPYSTLTRKPRDIAKGRLDGRSNEIQRLIGRSMRAAVDLEKVGPRTIWVDCDVLQADGGTRTAAITGASLAVAVACRQLLEEKKILEPPLKKLVAAVSVGVIGGASVLDLNYEEDKAATVDFNLVATEDGALVEVQGAGEEATFSQEQLLEMLSLGQKGIAQLIGAQRNVLSSLLVAAG